MAEDNKVDENSRRKFIKNCLACTAGFAVLGGLDFPQKLFAQNAEGLHIASYWEPMTENKVKCKLCPNNCILLPEKNGPCFTRGNRKGELFALSYAKPSVITLDDIEKSPLYHYQLKEKVFSIATAGCNLHCQFCQNWEISQAGPDNVKTFDLAPEEVIARAKKNNVNAINFFYTEPIIYYEYMLDIAKLAKQNKMKTFCITAGYISQEPLEELIPYIDAFVIGLKGFDDAFYKKYCGGNVEYIKETIKTLAKNKNKTWFEIVNLLITDLNDDKAGISDMVNWIKREVGVNIPLHFTRFEPAYKMMDIKATPLKRLEDAYDIAREAGMQYVYIGNIAGHKGNNTYCPKCGKMLIERVNYEVIKNDLKNGKCSCGNEIPGHWL
jgi:pyruvate formate lyase activating enzyme